MKQGLLILALRMIVGSLLCMLLLTACISTPPHRPMAAHPQAARGAEPVAYESPDHIQLFAQWWNVSKANAVILIAHGTALNSGFYEPLARHFQQEGYAVGAIDFRGWGQSGGFSARRGYIGNYDEYVEDFTQLANDARVRYPGKKIFLLGESMGGTIVLLSQIEHAIACDGLILSAPAVRANPGLSGSHLPHAMMAPMMWSGKVMGEVFPGLPLLPIWKPELNQIFFDQDARERFIHDPYNTHTWLPASYVNGIYDAMYRVKTQADKITTPILILQGDRDSLVPVDSSEYLCQAVNSQDRSLIVYEGMSHAALHDYGRESLWGDIDHWLDFRLKNQGTITYNGCPLLVHDLKPPHLPYWVHQHWFHHKKTTTKPSSAAG